LRCDNGSYSQTAIRGMLDAPLPRIRPATPSITKSIARSLEALRRALRSLDDHRGRYAGYCRRPDSEVPLIEVIDRIEAALGSAINKQPHQNDHSL
jgi:hypothetical protein